MANIGFMIRGNSDNAPIYIQISLGRGKQFRRKSGYSINPNLWSTKKRFPKQTESTAKRLSVDLERLKAVLLSDMNEASTENTHIDADWLQKRIDVYHGNYIEIDRDRLVYYLTTYIEDLPTKRDRSKRPISEGTIKKYKTILLKIEEYERYAKKDIYIRDIGLDFRRSFLSYLRKVDKLSDNTAGRYIKFVKTVCLDAKIHSVKTHPQLEAIKGFTEDAEKIHLTFDEIKQIESAHIVSSALCNARDWLLIGCYIGQRVSDLLPLTDENIIMKDGVKFISVTQQKTGKAVMIPIHPIVEKVLERNSGFPYHISDQKFNEHIKKVAKAAGLDEPTEGSKSTEVTVKGKKAYRDVKGTYPKWELVTSHICRRSFASNYYGEMPTSLIISITGHSTETQFLEYVGKPQIDQAFQVAQYLNEIYQKQQKQPFLSTSKKAN